jgi:hypothetical protein
MLSHPFFPRKQSAVRPPRRATPRNARRPFRPTLEGLEDRCVPAPITVTNNLDSGPGSLRAAITQANTDNANDAITFAAGLTGQTIQLLSALPAITSAMTIQGPGTPNLTVSGNNMFQVFNVAPTTAGAAVTLSGLTIAQGNAAGNGGGVLNNNASLTLSNDVLTANVATGDGGGVFSTGASAVLTVTNTTFGSNRATGASSVGAGLANEAGSTANLSGTTFAYNVAQNNGGAAFSGKGAVALALTNCTLVGNTSTAGFGGGLSVGAGNLTVNDSTITNNLGGSTAAGANSGGISFSGGMFTLNNTVVAQNAASSGPDPDVFGAVNTGAGNFIGVQGAGLTGIANMDAQGNRTGTAAAPLDPLLGSLRYNGGPNPAQTRAPLSGSPLIDKGIPGSVPMGVTTDQRGLARSVQGLQASAAATVDVGAVEFQPPATQTTLAASSASSTFGQAVTFTATVGAVFPGTTTPPAGSNLPQGTVTFRSGSTVLGTVPLAQVGMAATASLTTTALPTGSDSVTATYNPSTGQTEVFSASTSNTLTQTVNAPTATASATVSLVLMTPTTGVLPSGQTATFTVTVAAALGATGTPSGGVLLLSDGGAGGTPNQMLGSSATLDNTGKATITASSLPAGKTVRVVAVYSGDGTFKPATSSPPVSLTAQNAMPNATNITVPTASGSAVFNQFATYTATVTAQTAGTGTPTGTVTFFANAQPLGTVALDANGVATLTTNQTPFGASSITAQYNGDANFAASAVSTSLARTTVRQSTIGTFDPTSGNWFLRNSNSAGPFNFGFVYGLAGWRPVVGDWDGNGTTTPGVVDPASNTWYLRNENSSGLPDVNGGTPFPFGAAGWLPLAGHWAGAGTDGIGAYDPTTSTFYLRNSATAGAPDFTVQFGTAGRGLIPVAGDWTGTGRTSIGVYDPATSTWTLRNTVNPADTSLVGGASFNFGGGTGWKPVVGDWTAQGKTTIGVVDPSGNWYLRSSNSAGGPDVAGPFPYGLPFWTPLGGTWGLTAGQAVPANPLALPLRAAVVGPLGTDGALLSQAELDATVQEALGLLGGAGVDPGLLARLGSAQYVVGKLAGDYLGLAFPAYNRVVVSATGAGWGWSVDAAAAGVTGLRGTAADREDLLTTVLHEMGHLAGLPDRDGADGLMAEFLAPGVRHTQTLDQVFAGLA